jgi:hypothetical protein
MRCPQAPQDAQSVRHAYRWDYEAAGYLSQELKHTFRAGPIGPKGERVMAVQTEPMKPPTSPTKGRRSGVASKLSVLLKVKPGRERRLREELTTAIADPAQHAALLERVEKAYPAVEGVKAIYRQDAHVLPSGREPFGFKDGISQPAVDGSPITLLPPPAEVIDRAREDKTCCAAMAEQQSLKKRLRCAISRALCGHGTTGESIRRPTKPLKIDASRAWTTHPANGKLAVGHLCARTKHAARPKALLSARAIAPAFEPHQQLLLRSANATFRRQRLEHLARRSDAPEPGARSLWPEP